MKIKDNKVEGRVEGLFVSHSLCSAPKTLFLEIARWRVFSRNGVSPKTRSPPPMAAAAPAADGGGGDAGRVVEVDDNLTLLWRCVKQGVPVVPAEGGKSFRLGEELLSKVQ